jgi:hypothetical protein
MTRDYCGSCLLVRADALTSPQGKDGRKPLVVTQYRIDSPRVRSSIALTASHTYYVSSLLLFRDRVRLGLHNRCARTGTRLLSGVRADRTAFGAFGRRRCADGRLRFASKSSVRQSRRRGCFIPYVAGYANVGTVLEGRDARQANEHKTKRTKVRVRWAVGTAIGELSADSSPAVTCL